MHLQVRVGTIDNKPVLTSCALDSRICTLACVATDAPADAFAFAYSNPSGYLCLDQYVLHYAEEDEEPSIDQTGADASLVL